MKIPKYRIFLQAALFSGMPVLEAQAVFTDVTDQAGISHVFEVYEGTYGGGATAFDIDNDGFEDLYITGGTAPDALYLNMKDGTFRNIYETSGLSVTKGYVTQGVVSADVNRDGYRDLFITTINTTNGEQQIPRARNLLFLNNHGDLSFRDATEEFGLGELYSFSTGPSFGDINADGYPDLFVGNYFKNFTGKLGIMKDATIVSANQTAEPFLLINQNGRKFENLAVDYGLEHRGFGFGALFTDYDNDADQDLLVNQDFGYKAVHSYLYENQYPKKHFEDRSDELQMDLKINAMGSAAGDFDNNGYMDYFVTNIKFNLLMVNKGPGKPFEDEAKAMGTHSFAISWGANFADFDHDGDLDLYVSNGDLNPNCTAMGNFYFENEGEQFIEKGRESGINDYGLGRGSIVFDIENDGDMDLLVVNQKPVLKYPTASVTRLFRNDRVEGNWLKVALKGKQAEFNGIGSRVTVVANGSRMIREIDGGGSSHLSQNSVIAHFGLGKNTEVDSVIITWTGGNRQTVIGPKINTMLIVEEIPATMSYNWFLIGGIALLVAVSGLFFIRRAKRN